jgi:integrase
VPLPDGLTPHKLRHTFASILVALGVYRHGMRRDVAAKERLRALVGDVQLARVRA